MIMDSMRLMWGVAAFAVVPVAVLSGCSTGSHQTAPRPTPQRATGVVTGLVGACTGVASPPPQNAIVRIRQAGSTVASARIVAGDPAHDHYRVAVAPGRYSVVASNWPDAHPVVVTAGATASVNFPDMCD
jgi:hypothetical protein